MRAGIFYETGRVGVETLPMPKAEKTDVVVKVLRAGICGADLFAYRDNDRLTCVKQKGDGNADGQFGHELVGRVTEVGEAVRGVSIGDLVWVNPTTAHRTGMAEGYSGGFSEYMLVEDAAYGYNLVCWNEDVDLDRAALMEPLCVGTHGANQAGVTNKDKVVILGAGPIGLCALAAVLQKGCERPVIIDRCEHRLKAAEQMGGIAFCPSQEMEMGEFLMQHFGRQRTFFGMPIPDVDAYIDCAGAPSLLDQALHLTKDKTRLAIVAGYAERFALDISFLSAMQVSISGSRAYEAADIEEAYRTISEQQIDLAPIVTHHFPLEELTTAFATADCPDTRAIKVLIDIGQ